MKTPVRTYSKTHPWISFRADLAQISYKTWILLGEARSKCEHLSMVPLKPAFARELHQVALIKGALATTAIEGNTLSEDEVRKHIEGTLKLPPSREYLGVEVDNVLKALNEIGRKALRADRWTLDAREIRAYNAMILKSLELDEGVVAGEYRNHEVAVGRYSGAPARDCEYLMEKLCEWLNGDDFKSEEVDPMIMGVIRAVLAHLYIAWIHPFGDGNGRTARLIEFQILISAGLPTPAAHLLSNHYNRTRSMYYRVLDAASKKGGTVRDFLHYAVEGMVGELADHIALVWQQQWALAWRDHVHETLRGDDPVSKRRRHLVLDIGSAPGPVEADEVPRAGVRLAADYAGVSSKTVQRDLQAVLDLGLILREGKGYVQNVNSILAYVPGRKRPPPANG